MSDPRPSRRRDAIRNRWPILDAARSVQRPARAPFFDQDGPYTGTHKRRWITVTRLKIVIEHHPDGYVAYPLGLNGAVVGQGDTYDAALADVTSAIHFHIETFGPDAFDPESPVLDVFLTETSFTV